MQGPCCVGVVRDENGLIGQAVSIDGCPAYFSPGEKKIGVIVIHDIWGFNIPNAKYICDHFAKNGFPAVLPNLYHEISTLDGWSGTEFDDGEPMEGTKWDDWWNEITGESYWGKFNARMSQTIDFLKKEHGCTALCVIGFCWGGCAIEQLSTKGIFAQMASVHGCHDNAANYEAAKANGTQIMYHTVPNDESFPEDAQSARRCALVTPSPPHIPALTSRCLSRR